MSFFGSIKKLSLKKITATVTKTVKDATKIASGVATGGIAGGLSAVGSLSKQPSLTPTTVYGPDAAGAAPGAILTPATSGTPSWLPFALIGGGVLLLVLLMKK